MLDIERPRRLLLVARRAPLQQNSHTSEKGAEESEGEACLQCGPNCAVDRRKLQLDICRRDRPPHGGMPTSRDHGRRPKEAQRHGKPLSCKRALKVPRFGSYGPPD